MSLRDLIVQAKQKRNDEQFVVALNKYIPTLCKYAKEKLDTTINEVAFIIDCQKIEAQTYGYQGKVLGVYNADNDELLSDEKYVEYFDDANTIYDQIYLSEAITNLIDRTKKNAVLFVGTTTKTFKKGKEIYQSYPVKVINLE